MAKKILKDIPVADASILDRLAAFAPKEDSKSSISPPRDDANSQYMRNNRTDLGPLDLSKYLAAHSIDFNVKTDGSKTLYRLDTCLFDSNHQRNEAAIVQDDSGLLTYQCFHNSCRGYAWTDARKTISGEDNLAEFCEGYDPNWKPPRKKRSKKKTPPPQPDPDRPYKTETTQGRIRINIGKLAEFVKKTHFHDRLVYYQGHYCWYSKEWGYWKPSPDALIGQKIDKEIDNEVPDPPVDKCLKNLSYKAYLHRPDDSDPGVRPMFINLRNGILLLDSDTPQLIEHTDSMEFFTTVQVPTPYDPKAQPTLWIKTLMDIFLDDPAKIAVLQQFCGYLLYPKILFPAVMMQVGKAGAGKSTIQQVLTQLIGPQNVSHCSLGQMEKQFGGAQIMNKLLNTCAETETAPLESTTFKQISAGDRVSLDRKHAEHVVGCPIAKHLISTNSMPQFKEKGSAITRRLLILKFNHAFSTQDKDVHRADQLCEPESLAGILNWAIEGLEIILKDNQGKYIAVPASCEADMDEFKKNQEPVIEYIEDSGNVVLGPDCHVGRRECYRDYVDWCAGPGKRRPWGERRFIARIEELYDVTVARVDTKEKWIGIGLVYQPAS